MASTNWAAEQLAPSSAFASTPSVPAAIPAEQLFGVPTVAVQTVMRGMDHTVKGRSDTWPSFGPDFAAANYHGSLTTPLLNICVQS